MLRVKFSPRYNEIDYVLYGMCRMLFSYLIDEHRTDDLVSFH